MRRVIVIALFVFLVDQASKFVVVRGLDLYSRHAIDVLPPFVNFRMAWNEGINFGLLSGGSDLQRWALVVLSLAIVGSVWVWVRHEAGKPLVALSAGLLIGGALGNVIDRILYGAVADFLNMSLPGWENPYSFNVADISIFAGAVGLILFAGRDKPA
jgi:signal peptidase II